MIERILVGTPTSSEAAATLMAAAELATTHDAELLVLQVAPILDARSVFDPNGVPDPGQYLIPMERSFPQLRVRSVQAKGNALRAVCCAAEQEGSDLIVVPQARRGSVSSMLSRRASKALVKRASCPVLLIAS